MLRSLLRPCTSSSFPALPTLHCCRRFCAPFPPRDAEQQQQHGKKTDGAAPPLKANLTSTCPFECLGIERDATKDQVRSAYRHHAKQFHPDLAGSKSADSFRRVQNAQREAIQMIESGYAQKTYTTTSTSRYSSSSTGSGSTTASSSYSSYEERHSYAEQHRRESAQQEEEQQRAEQQKRRQQYYTSDYQGKWDAQARSRHRQKEREERQERRRAEEYHHRSSTRHHASEARDAAGGGSGNERSQFSGRNFYHSQADEAAHDFSEAFNEGFGDSEWRQFREEYLRQRVFTPQELIRNKFYEAATVQEIDLLFDQCLDSGMFEGGDFGRPLYLALERYQLPLGLGEAHVKKCFSTMDRWEERYQVEAASLYYQVLLAQYTDPANLALHRELDSSTASRAVADILERQFLKGVEDESGVPWWETLRRAFMRRDDFASPGSKFYGTSDRDGTSHGGEPFGGGGGGF